MDSIFTALDLSGVATDVAGLGVLVIGIWMVYKGIDLAKRALRKA